MKSSIIIPGSAIRATAFICLLAASLQSVLAEAPGKSTGIEKRTLWNNLHIHGTPDPPNPYTTQVSFPHLKFFEPLAFSWVPGADRYAIATRPGKIFTFINQHDTRTKDLLIDLKRTVYGVVMHPEFSQNGYFYVSSVTEPDHPEGSRLSRFRVTSRTPLTASPESEQVILKWPSGGHNGGCLRFGPDGYLYLATGDGSGIADERKTGQDLSDLLGAILRIDVDHAEKGQHYRIPADNPFISRKNTRGEIYSYGHRQVWKFSFDPATDFLWAGEIGQDLWEMIYRIKKGGNYGWSVQEGTHPFRPQRPKGPTPILKPIIEHSHEDFRSITGGFVYHGSRLPELKGHYVYGGYDTGRIWGFRFLERPDPRGKVINHHELANTQIRLVAFAQDPAGEIIMLDFAGGQLHQLVKAPPVTQAKPFPRKLSETGLFSSTRQHRPAPGLIPYSVNAPLWSDHAIKDRFIAIPGKEQIEFDTVTYPQPPPGAPPGWRFPNGTVLVKTFSLEMEVGNPKTARRLETRILHHERMPGEENQYGAQVWRGYTYIWNEEQTDATLLDSGGLNREFTVRDPEAPGGVRKQTWRFPSRAECTLCHTMASKYVLGVNTLQMNKNHDYGDVIANQLDTLNHLDIFTKPLPKPVSELPRLINYHDQTQDLGRRARSYLHANCAHCHQKWGGGNAEFQLQANLPLDQTGTVNTPAGQGTFGLDKPALLITGNPERSLIYHRMATKELGHMPHVGSNITHQQAVELIHKWIQQLAQEKK